MTRIRSLLRLGCFALLLSIYHPVGLDGGHQGFFHALLPFAIFGFWAYAVLGLGARVLQWMKLTPSLGRAEHWGLSAALGTLAFAQVLTWAEIFGWVGSEHRFIGLSLIGALLLLSPSLRFSKNLRDVLKRIRQQESWFFRLALGLVSILFFLRVLDAFRLHGHGDALLYHLFGPRMLYLHGSPQVFQSIPVLFETTYWESLVLMGNALLTSSRDLGLMELQRFGQWNHAVLGLGGSLLLLYAGVRRLGFTSEVGVLAVLLALFTPDLQWTTSLAKNDWGVVLWTFAGLLLVLRERLGVAGLFFGTAFLAKFSSAFLLLPLSLALMVRYPRQAGWLALGGVLGLLPQALRNWIFAANPLFPAASGVFGTQHMSVSWQGGLGRHPLEFSTQAIQSIRQAFERRGSWHPASFTLVGWLVVALFHRRFSRASLFFLASLAVGFLFYLITIGINAEYRWMGPTLVLLSASGALGLSVLPSFRWVGLAVVVWLMVMGKPPFHILIKPFQARYEIGAPALLGMAGGDAKAWMRKNLDPAVARIATFADNEFFYISEFTILQTEQHVELDQALYQAHTPQEQIETLARFGATHILDVKMPCCGWSGRSAELREKWFTQPDVALFRDERTVVASVSRLLELAREGRGVTKVEHPAQDAQSVRNVKEGLKSPKK